jgi:hypothetical protein
MLYLRKLLKLPTPKELGWGPYNALPSREFTPDCQGPTWEDWHVEVKKLHPVKYWIAETFGDFLRYEVWFRISRPFEDFHYWFVSHFIPSRRYHMLDLRQPLGKSELVNHHAYRYGWADVCSKMLYAMFNLLGEYLKEEPYDLTENYTLEQINADIGLKMQHESLQEARAIHQWWNVGRKEEQKIYDELLARWCDLRKSKAARDNGEADQMFKVLKTAEEEMEEKTDQMIARLMKIRRNLWT